MVTYSSTSTAASPLPSRSFSSFSFHVQCNKLISQIASKWRVCQILILTDTDTYNHVVRFWVRKRVWDVHWNQHLKKGVKNNKREKFRQNQISCHPMERIAARLAYKSSSNFFTSAKRERWIFLCFLLQKRAKQSRSQPTVNYIAPEGGSPLSLNLVPISLVDEGAHAWSKFSKWQPCFDLLHNEFDSVVKVSLTKRGYTNSLSLKQRTFHVVCNITFNPGS